MGILRLLRNTVEALLDVAMVLKEYEDDCKGNTEEKSTDNGAGNVKGSSNSSQDTIEESDRLSEQVSDTTSGVNKCEGNTEEKSTDNGSSNVKGSSNSGQDTIEESDKLSEQVSGTTSVENGSKNEAGACSIVSSDKSFHSKGRQRKFVSQNLDAQMLQVMSEGNTGSTSLRPVKKSLELFKTLHYTYCYDAISKAFGLMGGHNYVYATPFAGNLIAAIVGNDSEKIGLCFFVLKVNFMFDYAILHWSNQHAEEMLVDQRLLTNPDIINMRLWKVLNLLSYEYDIHKRVRSGRDILYGETCAQKFTGPMEHYTPQFYKDVLHLLCNLCEYHALNCYDENGAMVDNMIVGCLLMLGGMYCKIYNNIDVKSDSTFRDRIGDSNTAERCNDIGERCYTLLKTLLCLYKYDAKCDTGIKCGGIVIPRSVAAQCSENLFKIVENCYSNGNVPYGIFVRDIVKSITKLVDRYSIGLLACDICLYEQRYDSRSLNISIQDQYSLSINEFVKQRSNINAFGLHQCTIQEPIQSDEESRTVSEALSRVQISEEGTVEHSIAAGEVDYSKLGARPKGKRASESSGKSASRRQSVPVSTDDTEDSICTEEVEEHIGHKPATVKVYSQETLTFRKQVRPFKYEHFYYLYLVLKMLFTIVDGNLCPTYRCKSLCCNLSNGDPNMEKLCVDVLKISVLCQLCFLFFGKTNQSKFYPFNGQCLADIEKYVNPILSNILGIVKSGQNLHAVRESILSSLVQHNAKLSSVQRVPYNPKFYRGIMCLLCKLCKDKDFGYSDTKKFSQAVVSQMMLGCTLMIGGMYSNMDGHGRVVPNKEDSPLSYKFYYILRMFMYMYSTGNRRELHCKKGIPDVLYTLCSTGLMCAIKQNYSDGKVPFWLCVNDVVDGVYDMMNEGNIKLVFQDIEKYEHTYNQDRQSEGHLQSGCDGSNDNVPYKVAGNSGRGL